jgi:hypothetical protein
MTLNTTVQASGVSIASSSQITFANAGYYLIEFAAQFTSSSGANTVIDVWLSKNGTNVTGTDQQVQLTGGSGAFTVASWNYLVNPSASDYYVIYWSAPSTSVSMPYQGSATSPTRPSSPSVNVNVTQVMYTQSGYSGTSGFSGYSGYSGLSGYSGTNGTNGLSGYSGISGYSGYSGSGISGYSGYSGYSGSGISGFSGYSGYSGAGGGGTPGGSNTQVQYNSSGSFAGSANMTFNGTSLTLANDASIHGLTVGLGGGSISTNTAVGASALAGSNSGSGENVGVGINALNINSTGAFNTAVGGYCMNLNTTGVYNSALGDGSLTANTSGGYNTSIGTQALRNNTTASYNTAVGYQALYSQVGGTGLTNTALGYQSGYSITTATDCIAIGQALHTNQTGNANIAVGNGALYSTTGGSNTAIGAGAGYNISSGTKNTIIGAYSGNQGGLDIRTSSNNIVLSDGDGNPLAYTQNGKTFVLPSGTISSGTGIAFPATQNPSSEANTLDDYEKGTWTPTQGGNLTVVGSFSSSGTYTKIGRFVVARGTLTGSTSVAFTGGSPAILCGGLPFTSAATALGNAVDNNFNQGIVCVSSGTSVYGSSAITATPQITFSALYFV